LYIAGAGYTHKFRNNLDQMELLYAQYNNLLDLEPPKIEER
jgi:hypothetical protein